MSLPRVLAAWALALLPVVPACTCAKSASEPGAAAGAAASSVSASSSASAATSVELSQPDPDIKPVYPPLTGPPHPLAQKFCDAVQSVQARRLSECCSRAAAPAVLLGQCQRTLTGALVSGAVEVEEAAIARCAESMEALYKGCDWVQPPPFTPPMPAACQGLFRGTLKAGSVCRSNLECEGEMVCVGLGPTSPGRCRTARDTGPCSPAADTLATYTRQNDVERRHPMCTGWCNRKSCAPRLKEGEACTLHEACGPDLHCGEGVCRRGSEGKEGEKCLGTRCATGLKCDGGTCVAPRAEGAACERDEQCRGSCVRQSGDGPDANKGTCVARCNLPAPGGSGRPRVYIPPTLKNPAKKPAR